jgi:hypothetical protein
VEAEQDFTYDLVVRMRPDLIVGEPIPKKVLNNPRKLWHTYTSSDIRVSDKFAASSSQNMDYYSSVWENLDTYWENPFGRKDYDSYSEVPYGDVRVGERLMRYHMDQSDIYTEAFFYKSDIRRCKEVMQAKDYITLYDIYSLVGSGIGVFVNEGPRQFIKKFYRYVRRKWDKKRAHM